MSSTGQIVGGVIGTVVGMWAGYPMLGAQLGMLAGGLADPPKGPTTVGPRLSDLTVQTSTYGAVIPRVYGTDAFSGNVFWLEGNAIKETMVKKKSGGKGGGSKSTTKTFVNTATFAVGLCQGPIAGIRRIWIKGELFYDAGSSDPSTIAASNLAAEGFQVYLGTDTQAPDPRIQADVGAANCPAWRGLAYLVFYDLPLAKYGDALMGAQVKVEVMKLAAPGSWTSEQTVLPASTSWGSMAASPTTAVCVAGDSIDSNLIAVTHDGLTWASKTVFSASLRYCVAWGENVFIVMRSNSGCYKSTDDGETWSQVTSSAVNWTISPVNAFPPISSHSYGGICYGTDRFCAVSSDMSATTDDGVNWRKGAMPAVRSWIPIAHNGTVFCTVAGATAKSATSTDGLAWTEHTMAATGNWCGLAYGAGLFVAVGTSGGSACQTSPDGVTWTVRSIGGSSYKSVVWSGSFFFAAPYGGSTASVSLDGITWTTHTLPVSANWRSACPFAGGVLTSAITSSVAAIVYAHVSGLSQPLSDIVSTECVSSGLLDSGDIDVASLTSMVRGYLVASTGTIRSALEPLQAAWPFDVVQRGYKIKFLPRGGSSVVTIDADDLDARSASGKPGVQITTSREMDSQLPRVLTIKHVDYDREYEAGEQYVERLNTDAINDVKMELPIVLTAGEAVGKAETLLYLRWLERFDVSFSIPGTYNQLEPGDVVTLETPEGDISLRLVAINYTSDGRLECRAKYNNAAIYTPAALASSPVVTGPSTLPLLGPTTSIFLDVPYMHPAQADPSFLMAMYGASDTWPGAVLVRTDDYGSTWTEIQGFSSPGGAVGSASDTIGAVDSRVWDKGSVLSVSMLNGELFDATEIAVLNGGNHFAYGAPGRWEIIGVQKCTLISADNYKLSDMLRGRKGTEWAMSLHAIGDKVVALSETDVTTIGMSSSAIGLERTYRAVTLDMEVEGAADQLFTYQGVNLECLSPVYFYGYVVDATSDWSFSWIRRSRTDGEWRDLVDVGLGETTEAYELDIFTDNTYTTVKRTITATTQTCLYTSAQQVADFGSNQATVYAKVYQMSSIVGRGYPATW